MFHAAAPVGGRDDHHRHVARRRARPGRTTAPAPGRDATAPPDADRDHQGAEGAEAHGVDGLDDAGRRRLRRAWWWARCPPSPPTVGADDRPCRPAAGPLLRRLLRRPGPLAHARAAGRPGRGTGLRGLPHRRQDLHLLRPCPRCCACRCWPSPTASTGASPPCRCCWPPSCSPWRRSACSAACGASCVAPIPSAGTSRWPSTGLAVVVLVAPPLLPRLAGRGAPRGDAWGIALTVAGFDAVVRWQRRPTVRGLVVPSLLVLRPCSPASRSGRGRSWRWG